MKLHHLGVVIVCLTASACAPAEPRSQQYFEAHIDEARQIVEGCRDGSVRGGECDNADRAVQRAEAKERSKRFLGDGKAYSPRK